MATTKEAMDWGDYDPSSIQRSGNIWFRFPVGTERIRVASKPYPVKVHWVEDATGARSKYNCTGTSDCPLCKTDNEAKPRWMFIIIKKSNDGKDEGIFLTEVGPQIFGQLVGLEKNTDWPPIRNFDVRVKRDKQGPQMYTITPIPSPQGPLTDAQKEAVEEFAARVKIGDIAATPTVEELKAKLEGVQEDFSEFEDGDSEEDVDSLLETDTDSEEDEDFTEI